MEEILKIKNTFCKHFIDICFSLLYQVSAKDVDDGFNGKVLYFLSQEAHGAFTVDENTGRITTSAPLDREKLASYSFQVFAVDLSPAAPRNSSAQVKKGLGVEGALLTKFWSALNF